MVRARLIISAVLVSAFCVSIAALVLDMRSVGSAGPAIHLPGHQSMPTSKIDLGGGQIPATMPPHIPGLSSDTPSGILNLTNWKLTLPAGGHDDEAPEVSQPKLIKFRDPRYFHVDSLGDGVVFRAPVSGATTGNSNYPRSELREMTDGGKKEASWSGKSGTHVMTITEAITAVPRGRPQVVAGQIHDSEDDVVMLRLNGTKLFVEADGKQVGVLDPAYTLGRRFTVQFVATPGLIRVTYNGLTTASLKRSGSHYYFKAGCYTQANKDNSEDDSYGEVVINSLAVQHVS